MVCRSATSAIRMCMPDPLGGFLVRPKERKVVLIYHHGVLTEAKESVPGVWRCGRCGERVRVVY